MARTLNRALDPKEASPVGDAFQSDGGQSSGDRHFAARYHDRLHSPKPGLDRLFDTLPITPHRTGETSRLRRAFLPCRIPARRIRASARAIRITGSTIPRASNCHISIPSASISSRITNRTRTVPARRAPIIEKLDPAASIASKKTKPGAARSLGPSLDSDFIWFNQSPPAPAGVEAEMVHLHRFSPRGQPRHQSRRHRAHRLSAAVRIPPPDPSRPRIASGSTPR